MKKIFTLFVAALFATSLMYADPIGGSCGDGTGLNWSFEDGTLTITYDGEGTGVISFPDEVLEEAQPWYDWCDAIESISLPEGLKVIGANAFQWSAITSITIPNSVTEIDYYAFWKCKNLETINFGSGLESFGEAAFSECTALTSVTLPNSVTTIGDLAFESCIALASVTLSDNLETIDEYAFQNCSTLTSFTIPESVTFIGVGAFYGCTGMTDVYCYPDPMELTWNTDENLDDFKTEGDLTKCHVNSGTCLGRYEDKFGKKVNVEFVGDLDKEIDPTECGGGLHWAYAEGTLTITYDNTYEGGNDGAIISVTPMPWDAYLSEITSISLPEGLKRLGVGVFKDCSAVEEVTIPSSVSKIEYDAFKSCSSLKSVIALPTTAPTLGANVFEGCHEELTITYPCGSTESYTTRWSQYSANLESTCETPTGIDEISNSQSSNRKFLQDGHLFIEKNGKFYNATGAEVK